MATTSGSGAGLAPLARALAPSVTRSARRCASSRRKCFGWRRSCTPRTASRYRYLWNGNHREALACIDGLANDLDDLEDLPTTYPGIKAFRKGVDEFCTYVRRNAHTIPNYAERHRYGERVSTAFAESTVNAVVGKRFAKRQQMRWSKRGAHLMLQTRTRVLDDTLRAKFQRWCPGLFHVQTPRIAPNMTSLLDPTDFGTSLFVEGGRLGLVQNPDTSVIVERPSAHFQRILSADPAICLRQVREDMGGEMRSRDPLGL